jgi:magnesium transporter
VHSTIFPLGKRSFEWINFQEPNETELEKLAQDLKILPIYIQDIMQAEHLPKVEPIGEEGCFFLIARVLDPALKNKEFNSIQEATRKLAIFYQPDQVISIQRSPFPWLDEMIGKAGSLPSDLNSFQLVCKLLKQTFRSYEPLLFKLVSDLDFFEGKLFENERFPPFAKSLYAIRRKASILKRLFTVSSPLMEFLQSLSNSEPLAQDAMDMFNRIVTLVEDVNERASNLINLNLSISSQRSNEVMRFLTIYSAFFMPLTFLVGVYGMNFRIMPELDWAWGYGFCWALMLGMAGFHFWWFRRKNWL